jgi:RimJ/RimL family protein N-acetyltransferase
MTESKIEIVRATCSDISEVKRFMFEFGPTEHNVVVDEPISQEFDQISTGDTICFKALMAGRLVGIATCNTHRKFPKYESSDRKIGYLSQNVVLPELRGKGIGSELVRARKSFLLDQGVQAIYVTHHADNLGSAGALQHAGFVEVEAYPDPEKRLVGSRKTTVRKFELEKVV